MRESTPICASNKEFHFCSVSVHFCSGPDILADITRQFFEDATALLADLDRFIKENNFPGIASVAHTLKGSSATFGLNRAEQIARQIELAVNAADTEAVCCWVECLTTALADGRTALESELEKP